MLLRDFLPDPKLKEFVQCYRIAHFEFANANERFFKAYPPKPEVCLHFILRGKIEVEFAGLNKKTTQFAATLIGQQTAVIPRYNSSSLLNFQIVFQPTAVFLLTGIPAYELADTHLDAEAVFPDICFILEELQHSNTYEELLKIADRFVTSLIRNAKHRFYPLDSIAIHMIKKEGESCIDRLAKEACLCTKQFKRKFYERVGVNPKTYARIIRFNKAFNTKNANPTWDWLKIATACDYFDYQHLVKDYKSFTKLTPNAFHLQEKDSPECKLGLAGALYKSRFQSASIQY